MTAGYPPAAPPAETPAERRLPALRRPSTWYAAGAAALGIGLTALIASAIFGIGERREPARPIQAAGIGQTFQVLNTLDEPEAEVTVLSGTRSVYREWANISLQIRVRAFDTHHPSSFDWRAYAGGRELSASISVVTRPSLLREGETAEGSVSASGLPPDEPIRITYQGHFDDEPLYELVVEP
ncbi:MAG: hypothetical protein M3N29_01490 [Chloroflexota bacterium]|nr:hypothetical protein [Chloroflexota bacterium]